MGNIFYRCQGSSNSNKYDAFLSFRGPDIRNGFAAHLYSRLEKSGVETFLDRKKLETGKSIELGLKEAIESSTIQIPIFSKNYAKSPWCLEELTNMCKSGRSIIPVFLDVSPKDLRHPDNGLFAEAFRRHENQGKYNKYTIVKWKKLLKKKRSRAGRTDRTASEGEIREESTFKTITTSLEFKARKHRSDDSSIILQVVVRVERLICLLDLSSQSSSWISHKLQHLPNGKTILLLLGISMTTFFSFFSVK